MGDLTVSQAKNSRAGQRAKRATVFNRIIALEPRFMFDAAGAATNDAAAHPDAAVPPSDHGQPDHAQPAADPAFLEALAQSVPAAAAAPANTPASDGAGRHEVVFVDSTIANYQALVDGARPGVEVVVLDASRDGLAQMAEYLNGRSNIDSVQIMAHGSAGRFALGAIDVNADTLRTHGAELAAIGRALTADGDILIYACNTGAGIDGQAFIIDLARMTGADVAASSDNTGAAALGGNWALETRAGTIESAVALTAQAQDGYDALMTATITLLSGSANPVSAMGTVGTKTFIAADFDGDGDTDFIFRNNSTSPNGVDFWRNSGGVFTRFSGGVSGNPFSAITWSGPNSAALAAGFSPFSMFVDDVDGDGDLDVINMASANGRGIWQNNSGIFTFATGSPTLPTVTANTQSVAGDFDGDGDIDVIIRNNTGSPTGVNFWCNTGGSFTLISSNATNSPFSAVTFAALAANFDARFMAAGDVDGDGDIDVINMTGSANPGRGIWRNDNGIFSIVSAGCLPVAAASGQFAAGDFDGDGDTDIAFRNASGTGIDFYRASGGTYAQDNAASPFSAIVYSGGANANFNYDLMTTLDIDSDGDVDIANFANSAGRGTYRNDLAPPLLTSLVVGGVTVSNANDPTGVNATPTITLNFNKTIQSAGTGKIYIREFGTDTLVTSVTATDNSKVSGVGFGSTLTINPGVTLSGNTKYYIQIDKGAFFDSDGATLGRLDIVNNTTMSLTSKTLFDFTTVSTNVAPVLANLNGDSVAWPGVGNSVTLDAGTAVAASDADFGAGAWNGATLTVQRSGTALSSDLFGFSGASGISISGGNLLSGATIIGTATNASGLLNIAFNGNATTALVNTVLAGVTYRNDTPTGDTTVRFTLADGAGGSVNADVTVTSDTIYVTNTTDTATIDVTNGVSFSEAVAIAAADNTGSQTLVLSSGFASQTAAVGAVSLGESLTLDADAASGVTISTGTITIGSSFTLTLNNGSGDTATISSALAGAGALDKTGAGTLTLSGTNTYTGTTIVNAGTLRADGQLNGSGAGGVTVNSGGTLAGSGTVNGGVTVASGGTLSPGVGGTNDGVGTLTVNGGLTIASGGTLAADVAGASASDKVEVTGAVTVTGATLALSGSHVAANGQSFVLISNDGTDGITGTFTGLAQGGTIAFNGVNLAASYAAGSNSNDFQLTGSVNQAPALGGTFTTAGAVADNATIVPFTGVTFTDAGDSGGTFTLAIAYTAANGTLASAGGGLTGAAGNYTLTASTPAALQPLLQALVFTPTANQLAPGGTVATTFTLTPSDSVNAGSANATTVVTATSINDTPASLVLGSATISTADGTNATVGTLSASDADAGQTLTYMLVSGAGDTGNAFFSISGTTLRANDASTLTAGTTSVRVRVSDGTASTEQTFTITVTGATAAPPAAPPPSVLPPPPAPPPATVASGNGPSSNTASDSSPLSMPSGRSNSSAGDSGGSDAGRSITLDSGGSSSTGVGRSVTLDSIGGGSGGSDAGRLVTLGSIGGQGGSGFGGSSGLSGATGSTAGPGGGALGSGGLSGFGSLGGGGFGFGAGTGGTGGTQPGSGFPGNQGQPEQGQSGQGQPGQGLPAQQGQAPNPTANPDQPQQGQEQPPRGTSQEAPRATSAEGRGAGTPDELAAMAPPAERAPPGFARQVASAHGGPASASALIAALAKHVLPDHRAT